MNSRLEPIISVVRPCRNEAANLPALVMREGFGAVHLGVTDRQRRHGTPNYGMQDRSLHGVPNLFGVWWLRRCRRTLPTVTEKDK